MRAYTSILICVLVAYYPCNGFFSDVWNQRRFSKIDSPLFKNKDSPNFPDIYYEEFEQRLDHFDPNVNITWKQRYIVNTKFFNYNPSSHIFLWVNGLQELRFPWHDYGSWFKYAEEYGALIIQLETRFYGESKPLNDMSTENLKYLNIEQVLADVAYFIEVMNEQFTWTDKNKWIVFGKSDGGSLAVWLRSKYPHLVHGAVSSSSPLLAKTDFYEYFDVVRSVLDTYKEGCSKAVTEAHYQLHQLLKTDAGKKKINELFWLCRELDGQNEKDERNLFTTLALAIAQMVEIKYHYNSKGRIDGIDVACNILTNQTLGQPLDRYAAFTKFFFTKEYPDIIIQRCIDYKYSKMVRNLRRITWGEPIEFGDRPALYQRCTELGFLQTSVKETSLFGPFIDLQYYEDICTDVFGPSFTLKRLDSGVNRTNSIYGGLNNKATRVVYVQGSLDPWYPLGITNSSNPEAPAIFIKGASHNADTFQENPTDPPELIYARVKISALIGKWLREE